MQYPRHMHREATELVDQIYILHTLSLSDACNYDNQKRVEKWSIR